jgi:serine/threonine protein kinase/tetratricopeptide (TPR) repeat protein
VTKSAVELDRIGTERIGVGPSTIKHRVEPEEGGPTTFESEAEVDPVDLLAEEFLERCRRGERPTIEEYALRYPELGERIHRLFRAMLIVEDLKPEGSAPSAGLAAARCAAPERLGDYRIIREVGRGAMGVVYEAEQESLGRRVALKVMTVQGLRNPKQLLRFHREARATARLHHINIVPVFGVGECEGMHYYVMQFIAGLGLDAVLEEIKRLQGPCPKDEAPARPTGGGAPSATEVAWSLMTGQSTQAPALHFSEERPAPGQAIPSAAPAWSSSVVLPGQSGGSSATESAGWYPRSVALIGMQVADALDYAHRQGILHRDIKPSNLLLDGHGTVWVADFGLAKAADGDDLTHSGDILGTIRYMAPERFEGRCDARSDVYALGLTLYELLARRPAFESCDHAELIRRVTQEEPPRLQALDPTIPRDLETVVQKAIAREPGRRYDGAGALAEDLRRFVAGEAVRARRTGLLEKGWRWCRRNPTLAAAIGSTSLALIAAAVSVGLLAGFQVRAARQQVLAASHLTAVLAEVQEKWARTRLRSENVADARNEVRETALGIEAVLQATNVDERLREQARRIVHRVVDEVQAEETFRNLLDEFDRIRSASKETGPDGSAADHAAAALVHGIGLLGPAARKALDALVRGRPGQDRARLAAALESWAMVERERVVGEERCRALIGLAGGIDPDPMRNKVRNAWLGRDEPALIALAHSRDLDELGPSGVVMLASWLVSNLNSEAAVSVLRRGRLRYPYDVWINFDLALNLSERGRADEAEAVTYFRVARALQHNIGHELAHLLELSDQSEEAQSIFQDLAQRSPDNAQHPVCLANVLRVRGEERETGQVLVKATEKARQAVERRPDDPMAHIVLGNALARSGQAPSAIAEFRRALRLRPESPEALINLANLLRQEERFPEAIALYREFLRLRPKSRYALAARYNLGLALHRADQTLEAIREIRDVVRESPESYEAMFELGDALRRSDQPDEAIAEYRAGLALHPHAASTRFNLADLLRQRGWISLAIDEYRRALGDMPEATSGRLNLADLLRETDQPEDAISEYRRALRDIPSTPGGLYNLADMLCQVSRPEEAVTEYRRALAIDRRPPGLIALGPALRESGRNGESVEAYDQAIEALRSDPQTASRVGQDREWSRTLATIERRLPALLRGEDRPANAEEAAQFASAAFRTGDYEASLRLWRNAIAEVPDIADDVAAGYRFHAARADVAAASSPECDPAQQARWRNEDAGWLAAEFSAYSTMLRGTHPEDRILVRKRLLIANRSPELAPVLDVARRAHLPSGEHAMWRVLGDKLDALVDGPELPERSVRALGALVRGRSGVVARPGRRKAWALHLVPPGDDVLVRRQPGGRLEQPGEWTSLRLAWAGGSARFGCTRHPA